MAKSTTTGSGTTKAKTSRPRNTSLPARTARTVKERPYTSAAIATGAVAAVAAAAAGAVLLSRRDKSLRETGEDLAAQVKGGIAAATDKIKDLVGSGEEAKTQQQIAEEAMTLKETGANPLDGVAAEQTKTGAVTY